MNITAHIFHLDVFGLDKKLNLEMMIITLIISSNNPIKMVHADKLNVQIMIHKLLAPLLKVLHVIFKMENVSKFMIVHQFKVFIIVENPD